MNKNYRCGLTAINFAQCFDRMCDDFELCPNCEWKFETGHIKHFDGHLFMLLRMPRRRDMTRREEGYCKTKLLDNVLCNH